MTSYVMLPQMSFMNGASLLLPMAPCRETSGVARPRPTRACALPSAFQALPSPAQ